jgi:hypothetical protein
MKETHSASSLNNRRAFAKTGCPAVDVAADLGSEPPLRPWQIVSQPGNILSFHWTLLNA